MIPLDRVRADFDEIAGLDDPSSGTDRYDRFLVSLVPRAAIDILDVGSGLGRLCGLLDHDGRSIVGVDLSPGMVRRAQSGPSSPGISFICGDFIITAFNITFDCVISSAAMHHVPVKAGFERLIDLVRPGGRLIVRDLRRDESLIDRLRAYTALAHNLAGRLMRTGHYGTPPHVLAVWNRHGEGERYLSWTEAQQLAASLDPPAQIYYHWMWRYTLVWDKPPARSS